MSSCVRFEVCRASVCPGVALARSAAFRIRFEVCHAVLLICSGVAVARATAILLAFENSDLMLTFVLVAFVQITLEHRQPAIVLGYGVPP